MKALPENIVLAVREIKSAIVRAQSRVAANANAEMLSLYFGIGQYVSHKTKTEKWGTGVIDAISHRLQQEMPGLRGFSGKSIRTPCASSTKSGQRYSFGRQRRPNWSGARKTASFAHRQ
ncbi:MAG: hypothetical protein IJS87_06245 [Rhodocyclaceae bacterium]|nr:hypothetical protein [Rhodocyclaceae bacterium]